MDAIALVNRGHSLGTVAGNPFADFVRVLLLTTNEKRSGLLVAWVHCWLWLLKRNLQSFAPKSQRRQLPFDREPCPLAWVTESSEGHVGPFN